MKITSKEYDELCLLVQQLQLHSMTYAISRSDSDYNKMHDAEDLLIDKFAHSIDYDIN